MRAAPAPASPHFVQPATPFVPPFLQVRLSVPLDETVQLPSHEMLQVPALQPTVEPSPTVCVQSLPAQATLQFAPQVPVQLEVPEHEKLQFAVEALHASKLQLASVAQEQLVPLQTVPQPAKARANERDRAATASSFFMTRLRGCE